MTTVYPRPNILNWALKFVCTIQKMSSTCCTPVSAPHAWRSCWNSAAKCHLNKAEPESKQRTVTVSKFSGGPGVIEASIKVFGDIDWNEQRAATIGQGIKRMLAWYEEILKDKKTSLSGQSSALNFVKSSSGTRASPSALLDTGDDDLDDPSTVLEEVPPP